MIKKNIEKFTLNSIECVLKKEKSNRIKIELLNDKRRKIGIYFELFWDKDTPKDILQELINDAGIEINNKDDFINSLTILNKKNTRIMKVQST